ncbi:hypothetical protein N7462_009486 [Penicillium macrosclerotiorum]|uniref:uncharacterized protein n=1 Tax=Penicillium macrosclerotiorum TaxID=303699 RepID=UPI0025475909|nr:uncharacterized protein N7462_009486 [Penicillium macrosclerotiorum]KAJ5674047.1 hypothetical protein N7462_009486 [Penicillium macrosclerotiorum]
MSPVADQLGSPAQESSSGQGSPTNSPLSRWSELVHLPAQAKVGLIKGQIPILLHWNAAIVLVVNLVAIIFLSGVISSASDDLADNFGHLGHLLSALIGATLGNTVEITSGVLGLLNGDIVFAQSVMAGSILSDILLILGCCIVTASYNKHILKLNNSLAKTLSSLMMIAAVTMLLPTALYSSFPVSQIDDRVLLFSRGISLVLFLLYGGYLYSHMKSHKYLFLSGEENEDEELHTNEDETPGLSKSRSTVSSASNVFALGIRLAAAVAGTIFCTELIFEGIHEIVDTLGFSRVFIAVILVPIASNSTEGMTVIASARDGDTDSAIRVIVDSLLQIGLFVIPFLVIIGWCIQEPMTLYFNPFQSRVMFLAILVPSRTNLNHDSMPISSTGLDNQQKNERECLLEERFRKSFQENQAEQLSLVSFSRPFINNGPGSAPAQSVPLGESVRITIKTTLGESYTSYLLPFVFLGIVAGEKGWNESYVFLLNFLAILPLASLLSFSTEGLAKSVGQLLGGLINATFGNAVEMIVGITAVGRGETNIVQSNMVGSILSGSLLILGCCLFTGGYSRDTVSFNVDVSGILSSLMVISSASLIIPSVLDLTTPSTKNSVHDSVLSLSRATSVVLLIFYIIYLYFQLKSHDDLFTDDSKNETENGKVKAWGISRAFIGLIVVPVIGNAGEFNTAVTAAMKNNMDLSIGVIVGSTLQIALFVSPFLVICGWVIGQPMSLRYSTFETVVFFVSVIVRDCLIRSDRSNYYEGFLLIGT